MPGKQLRTANFSDDDRERFGKAVGSARRAAGFRSRRAFAEAARIGKRSVDAVETFEPVVGEDVLQAIGRTLGLHLDDWSEDTPRAILQDGVIPTNLPRGEVVEAAVESGGQDEPAPDPAEYADMEGFLKAVIMHLRSQGIPDEAITRAVAKIVADARKEASDTEGLGPDAKGGRVS